MEETLKATYSGLQWTLAGKADIENADFDSANDPRILMYHTKQGGDTITLGVTRQYSDRTNENRPYVFQLESAMMGNVYSRSWETWKGAHDFAAGLLNFPPVIFNGDVLYMQSHNLPILLSTPYSNPDPEIKKENRRRACVAAVELFNHGFFTISPVAYGLSIMEISEIHMYDDWETWKNYCVAMVKACAMVFVVNMPGWDASSGVAGEIKEAKEAGKPVYLIDFSKDPHEGPYIIQQL